MNTFGPAKRLDWKDVPGWLRIIVIVGIANFALCLGMDQYFGGSALNGYQQNHRSYIGSHGRYKEVTGQFWTFSYAQGISMYATHLSIFIGLAV